MVYNVWLVKTLSHQISATTKRRKLADGIYAISEEDDVQGAKEYNHYVDKLFSYLLSLAIAGSSPKHPPPERQEAIGADSTKYALVPLD